MDSAAYGVLDIATFVVAFLTLAATLGFGIHRIKHLWQEDLPEAKVKTGAPIECAATMGSWGGRLEMWPVSITLCARDRRDWRLFLVSCKGASVWSPDSPEALCVINNKDGYGSVMVDGGWDHDRIIAFSDVPAEVDLLIGPFCIDTQPLEWRIIHLSADVKTESIPMRTHSLSIPVSVRGA